LDARYARLYGLSRDDLRYILDPADLMGPDYPSETFRVLIEEAFKYIDNLVKKTAKPEDMSLTGVKLMGRVFNPTSPLLKINSGSIQSEIDEQNGYMQILSGCMVGIRNPRAHEHDWEDTEQRTMQLLVLADHLISRIKSSEK